jgi:hypothetical protein
VGIIVAVGGGVIVGTAVGGATVSVAEPPQALNTTMIRIAKRNFLTRTAYTPRLRINELYCLIFTTKNTNYTKLGFAGAFDLNAKKETHGIVRLFERKGINLQRY